jgi:hypothetical protein
MPVFYFSVTGEYRAHGYAAATRLTVWNNPERNDKMLIQATLESSLWEMGDTFGLHVADMNFDGFRDVIVLRDNSGAHTNSWYYC